MKVLSLYYGAIGNAVPPPLIRAFAEQITLKAGNNIYLGGLE